MECPKCHKSMQKLQWNLLRNTQEHTADHKDYRQKTTNTHHKEYERTLYVCETDDLWVTIEQPTNSQ